MKLGNGLGASGVYFLKVFFWGRQVEGSVCSEEWASCSALVWQSWLTIVNNALGWVSKLARSGECAQVAIFNVCYEWRICSVWQVAWCGIDIWAIIHMSLSERCNLLPSSGGWFEERRGASRVVTNPTVWARDRRVSIIDYGYRWRVSGIEFSSLTFATNSGFVRFDNVVNRMETFERETTYE